VASPQVLSWAHRLVAVIAVAWALFAPRLARADLEVVMFDPDANLGGLRSPMTSFLRTIDPSARFTPFTRLADLERHLEDRRVDLLIIAPETAARLGLQVTPLMLPMRGADITHHKVLLVRRGTRADDVRIIASTAAPAEVTALPIPGRSRSARKLRALRVTKGFDALLGLAFQRVDAAYVTPETLRELAKVDRTLAEGLAELYRSPPIPNAPLVATRNLPPDVLQRISAAFAAMDQSRTGRAALQLLDYTGWRAP
jgi:hypothetical protein